MRGLAKCKCNVFLVLLTVCLLAVASFAADESSTYLPLKVGKKWVLRSNMVDTPMIFEVVEKTADGYRVRWDNPWIPSFLTLIPKAGKVYVSAVTMNGQSAPMPPDTLYWDFAANPGAKWSNKIGTLMVVARDKTVRTQTRTYTNVVEIKENNQFWFFAPGVGFVQFGEGSTAFVLDNEASEAPIASTPAPAPPPTVVHPPSPRRMTHNQQTRSMPFIGVQANIFANEPLTPATMRARYQQSLEAGITFQGFSGTWAKLEPQKGKYRFNEIDTNVDEAIRADIPMAYTLSIIDTGMKTVPEWLKNTSWNDPKMQQGLVALIDAIAPHFRGHLRWVMIGNEIDPYFEKRGNEAKSYAELFRVAADRFRTLVPGVQVSHTVTFAGLALESDALKPVLELSDFLSLTYYPASGDFRFRDPGTVLVDFPKMIAAARGKKVLLQEVGYPSSPLNDSSEEKQAQFYANVFSQLQPNADVFIGANFLFMSDFSDSVVDGLVKYYSAPGAERFRAFLQTLGMFDGKGQPKKSWMVFQREANNMKS